MQLLRRRRSRWALPVALFVLVLGGVLPCVCDRLQTSVGIPCYYGSLFFTVLWASSVAVLFHVASYSAERADMKQALDYRVVHFGLRMALAFGIGAIIIAVLFVVAAFRLIIPT